MELKLFDFEKLENEIHH